jgi:hypothetical protein
MEFSSIIMYNTYIKETCGALPVHPLLLSIPFAVKTVETSFKLALYLYCTDSSSVRKGLLLPTSPSLGVKLLMVNSARDVPNFNIFDLHGSDMGSAADMDSRPRLKNLVVLQWEGISFRETTIRSDW